MTEIARGTSYSLLSLCCLPVVFGYESKKRHTDSSCISDHFVKDPDEDDWGRLKRVIKYLLGTKYLKFTFSIDNIGILKWYIDASYPMHGNCRAHTTALSTIEKGAITTFSKKQKLNSRSSTEAELIWVVDGLAEVL